MLLAVLHSGCQNSVPYAPIKKMVKKKKIVKIKKEWVGFKGFLFDFHYNEAKTWPQRKFNIFKSF